MRKLILAISLAVALASLAGAQDQRGSQSMPDRNMSGHDMSKMSSDSGGMKDMPGMDAAASAPAMHSMEDHHMDMGPHMKMTAVREPKPGDEQRAQKVVEAARQVSEKYKDYHTALADGYKIFLPNIPQKMYHFTNYISRPSRRPGASLRAAMAFHSHKIFPLSVTTRSSLGERQVTGIDLCQPWFYPRLMAYDYFWLSEEA
jgi:hypothetical protein